VISPTPSLPTKFIQLCTCKVIIAKMTIQNAPPSDSLFNASNGVGSNGVNVSQATHNKPTHASLSYDICAKIEQLKTDGKVHLDGSELDIASVIAVAK
jgi:hypothetical protein